VNEHEDDADNPEKNRNGFNDTSNCESKHGGPQSSEMKVPVHRGIAPAPGRNVDGFDNVHRRGTEAANGHRTSQVRTDYLSSHTIVNFSAPTGLGRYPFT